VSHSTLSFLLGCGAGFGAGYGAAVFRYERIVRNIKAIMRQVSVNQREQQAELGRIKADVVAMLEGKP
jgi:hypothetical protein